MTPGTYGADTGSGVFGVVVVHGVREPLREVETERQFTGDIGIGILPFRP
jgi:hypothetical protein